MIAVEMNLLVHAHRRDSAGYGRASAVLRALAEGTEAWAIPWPCIHEFLAVVLVASRVVGARVPGARVAVLCAYHGVKELWSGDRDFSRFPALPVRNPVVA